MDSTTRRGQVLTYDAIAHQYPPEHFILLMPQVARHLLTTVPMWSLDVATVKVNPDDSAQAYKIQGDEYGLTKVSLDLLAQAADLTVVAKRIDNRADRMFAEYEAWAIMNTPSGGVRGQSRTCEWDGVTAQVKVRGAARKYVDRGVDQRWNGFKNLTVEQYDRKVEERYEEQWAREQEFGKRMVESKAANRAVRAILGVQPKYPYDELRDKEFAIVRFVFTPDLEDREIRLMVVGAGLQAQRSLYPQAAMLPLHDSHGSGITTSSALQLPEQVQGTAALEHAVEHTDDSEFAPTVETPHDHDEWSDVEPLLRSIYFGLGTIARTDEAQYNKLNKRLAKYMEKKDAAGVRKLHEFMTNASVIAGDK